MHSPAEIGRQIVAGRSRPYPCSISLILRIWTGHALNLGGKSFSFSKKLVFSRLKLRLKFIQLFFVFVKFSFFCSEVILLFLQLWKAALVQGIGRLPRSLAILAVLVIPAVVLFFSPRWFWLLIFVWSFLWPAAAGYLWARLTVRLFGPLVN